jgi:hypothetical protein
MEGRRPVLAGAPAADSTGGGAPTSPVPGSPDRFGPDVTEVAVGDPAPPWGGAGAGAGDPVGDESGAGNVLLQSTPHVPEGAVLVDAGVYFSQRYLRLTAGKLQAMGLPHSVSELSRDGKGFRLTVLASGQAELGRARQAFRKGGYLFSEGESGIEAFFYLGSEVQEAASKLSQEGIACRTSPVSGNRPAWRVYVGPLPKEEAPAVVKRLRADEIPAYITRPSRP